MKLGAARATTIAAVNTSVQLLGLGLFVSEFTIHEGPLSWSNCPRGETQHVYVWLEGRTNTGKRVWAAGSVMVREPRDADFPIKEVWVAVQRPPRKESAYYEYDHFQCEFRSGEMIVNRREKEPSYE